MKLASRLVDEPVTDKEPLTNFQVMVAALCALVVAMDGFNVQAISYVAPALLETLHISRASLGPIFSSGLLGMLIGAVLLGPLADHIGRKPVLFWSTVVFALCSIVTARANSLQALIMLRLLTGVGLGGAMPNTVALTSEYMPKRLRTTGVALMFGGFSVGGAVGGLVSASLIPRFGWQSVFVAGGVLSFVIAVVVFFRLPESVQFLLHKGGRDAEARHYLSKVSPGVVIPQRGFPTGEQQIQSRFTVRQLFLEGRTTITLLLWAMFFMNLLALYLLNNWLPTVIHDAGITLGRANVVTSLFQGGGAVAAFVLGGIIDRRLSKRTLAWSYLAGGGSTALAGIAGASVIMFVCAVFAAGFFIVGGQNVANAVAAECYPTTIRSTGVGWALGIGRVGSILGPVLGGMLMSAGGSRSHIFIWATVPALLAAMAAFLIATNRGTKAGETTQIT